MIVQNYLIITAGVVGLVLFIGFCGWMADRQDARRVGGAADGPDSPAARPTTAEVDAAQVDAALDRAGRALDSTTHTLAPRCAPYAPTSSSSAAASSTAQRATGFDIVERYESHGGDLFFLLRSLPYHREPQVVLALRASEVDELRELLAAGQPSGPLVAELEAPRCEARQLRAQVDLRG